MTGITLDMFNLKHPLPLEPEENWHNADNDDNDDDDVVDSRSGLTETGSLRSLMIYAACTLDCVCMTANCKQITKLYKNELRKLSQLHSVINVN